MIRAKFTVTSITKYAYAGTTIKLTPVYDPTIPEDQRFAQATPSGEITMFVNNLTAETALALGTAFYVDFSPVAEAVPA